MYARTQAARSNTKSEHGYGGRKTASRLVAYLWVRLRRSNLPKSKPPDVARTYRRSNWTAEQRKDLW